MRTVRGPPNRSRPLLGALPATLALVAVLAGTAPFLPAQIGSFGNAVAIRDGQVIVAEPNPTFRPGAAHLYEKVAGA